MNNKLRKEILDVLSGDYPGDQNLKKFDETLISLLHQQKGRIHAILRDLGEKI